MAVRSTSSLCSSNTDPNNRRNSLTKRHKRGSVAENRMARSMGSVGYAFGMSTVMGTEEDFDAIYG